MSAILRDPLVWMTAITAGLFIGWRLLERAAKRAVRGQAADFARRYPGRCYVCAMGREARRQGIHLPPQTHDCREPKKDPPK
jgi:hypothetical protein